MRMASKSAIETVSQRDRTLAFAINDATLGQIVWRKLHANFVAWNDPDEVLPHSTSNVGHDLVAGFQLHTKASVGEGLCNGALDFKSFFFLTQN